MCRLWRPSLCLIFILIYSPMTRAMDEEIDCIGAVQGIGPGVGTIHRILKRDGFSIAKLYRSHVITGTTQDAILYQTADGRAFIIKPDTPNEVAAFIADRRLKQYRVPQTELVIADGKKFSAQKFVKAPQVKITNYVGRETWVKNIADIALNEIPEEFLLFDILIGNVDRSRTGGQNYFILTDEPLPSNIDLRIERPTVRNPRFIAFDNGLAFVEMDIDHWIAANFRIKISRAEIDEMIKRNPDFMRNVSEWSPAQIRMDLEPLLAESEIQSFLDRRNVMLAVFESSLNSRQN